MKKYTLILLLLLLFPVVGLAWDNCPYGEVDDPYPGKCNRYVDTDHDQICDLSQPTPENRIAKVIKTDQKTIKLELTNNNKKMTYHLVPISLFLIILYAISRILLKKKIITLITHKRIWNILLLITFLISGILGILLIIRINFNITAPTRFNSLFWHVELGIAMFIISIFHVIERWYFFKNIFKTKNNKNNESKV